MPPHCSIRILCSKTRSCNGLIYGCGYRAAMLLLICGFCNRCHSRCCSRFRAGNHAGGTWESLGREVKPSPCDDLTLKSLAKRQTTLPLIYHWQAVCLIGSCTANFSQTLYSIATCLTSYDWISESNFSLKRRSICLSIADARCRDAILS